MSDYVAQASGFSRHRNQLQTKHTVFYNTTVDIYHNGYPIFNIVIQTRKGAVIKMVPGHFAEGKGKEDAGVNDFSVGQEG